MSPATAGKVQGLSNDLELARIELDGKHIKAQIDGAITAASSERTIDGASTLSLTVNDPERILQGGRYYERRADVLYDDLWFRMVSVNKQGDLFTLTFEDREVAILRTMTKPKRQSRAQATRAQFLQSLVAEVPHIGFVCPELGTKQQIAPLSNADLQTLHSANKKTAKQRTRARGISLDAHLTVQGATADRTQIRLMNDVLTVAQDKNAGTLATLALVEACIDEKGFHNTPGGDATSSGLLQLLSSTAAGIGISALDVTAVVTAFLERGFYGKGGAISLARAHPTWPAHQIAQAVQGSATADGSNYARYRIEAQTIIKAYGGVDPGPSSDSSGTGSGAYVKSYEFSRGAPAGPKGEDTWACGQRLASEVQWRWFIVAGVVYFISDYDLIRSEPRMTINEDTPGVNNIDYTLDVSPRNPSSVTIDCQATKWAAPPGTVVVFTEDMGPVAGAWLVSDIVRNDLTAEQTTITLATLEAPKKEPASQVVLRSAVSSKDGGLLTGADAAVRGPSLDPLNPKSIVAKCYREAQRIDAKHYPYVFGGGHGRAGVPSTGVYGSGPVGYDCSGAVCAVLNAGGVLQVPPFTNGAVSNAQSLIVYGVAGRGQYMTVYALDEGGGNGHCFMEFTLPSGTVFFEFHHTGTIGGFEKTRDTTGFTARHWPGT